MKFKTFLPALCLILPSFSYANQQTEQVQKYLNETDKRAKFISTYMIASKSYREKREYTIQEQKDYMCNLRLLYSDLIHYQTPYLHLEIFPEVQTVNRQIEDNYHALDRSIKKLQIACSEGIINVPINNF